MDFLFFIFFSELNENSEDVWVIQNLRNEAEKPEVFMLPGKQKIETLNGRELLGDYKCQEGALPGGRAGHQVFKVSDTDIALIGGHNLATESSESPFKTFCHPKENLHLFDSVSYQWSIVDLTEENQNCLSRSNFSACINKNDIYITGGVRKNYESSKIENISVFEVLKLKIIHEDEVAIGLLTKIQIFASIERLKLSSSAMTYRNGKLYLYGGNTGQISTEYKCYKMNGDLIEIDLEENTALMKSPPDFLKGRFNHFFSIQFYCLLF